MECSLQECISPLIRSFRTDTHAIPPNLIDCTTYFADFSVCSLLDANIAQLDERGHKVGSKRRLCARQEGRSLRRGWVGGKILIELQNAPLRHQLLVEDLVDLRRGALIEWYGLPEPTSVLWARLLQLRDQGRVHGRIGFAGALKVPKPVTEEAAVRDSNGMRSCNYLFISIEFVWQNSMSNNKLLSTNRWITGKKMLNTRSTMLMILKYIWTNHLFKNNKICALMRMKTSNNNSGSNNTTTITLNVLYFVFANQHICVVLWSSVRRIGRWDCPKFTQCVNSNILQF